MRLDRFIQRCIPRLSRTRAEVIVKTCAYYEDGGRRRPSNAVRAGETVLLVRKSFKEPDAPRDFAVIFADDEVYVVDKPAGLPVHPSASYHRNTLTWLLRERFGDDAPKLAHRLDRETSGVLICGRTLDAERKLKKAFEGRRVEKSYLAIVRGVIQEDSGTIDMSLRPSAKFHLLMEPAAQGLPARTGFSVVERAPGHTLVALTPHTGRQHQLRVHLAELGHPIVGDKLYGPEGLQAFFDYIEGGLTKALLQRLGHSRHALHAHRLVIEHPQTGEHLKLESPLPVDLLELWSQLKQTRDAAE